MKFLLVAVNAKYIHSNPGVYSLKIFAEKQGGLKQREAGLPCPCLGENQPPVTGEIRIEIAEYTINNQMEQILEDIYRRQPEVVGFSCYIWNIRYVMELVRDLHKVLPDTDIWLGGPEVSYDAPQLLEKEPEVLGIMKGEGEETFAGLAGCYRELGTSAARKPDRLSHFWYSLSALPGVTFRAPSAYAPPIHPGAPGDSIQNSAILPGASGDRTRHNAILSGAPGDSIQNSAILSGAPGDTIHDLPLGPAMDLDRIPFPYQDEKGLEDFANRIIYYESSRGCPFSCSYCLSSVDKTVRFRSLDLVRQELQFFLDRQVPQVKFVDRTFNCRKSHAMAIWSYILEHDNGITNFHFEVAADLMDEEELDLLARMRPGLVQLEIGVQSTSSRTIQEIRRKMDLERVKAVVARIREGRNIHQHLDLIAGLPYEDYDRFRKSFCHVYRMKPDQLQLGFLKVLKGSHMYDMAAAYDLVYREKPPYEVISTRWLSYGEVLKLKGVENMVEVYYNSGQFATVLELLEEEFPDSFIMFGKMAEYYRRKGLEGQNHSRLARFEILHDFIAQELGPDALRLSRFEDALMFDLYLRENAKSRPGFALDQRPYKDRIRELVPELRSLGSQVHVEVFRSGQVWMFDYRQRDPLTRNARAVQAAERLPEIQTP